MSRFFSFVLLLVVLTVCVGFFRGWFSVSSKKEPFSEKLDVHFQVDQGKIKEDASAVEEKTKSLLGSEKVEGQLPK